MDTQDEYIIKVYKIDRDAGSVPDGAEPAAVLGPVTAPDPWCAVDRYVDEKRDMEAQ